MIKKLGGTIKFLLKVGLWTALFLSVLGVGVFIYFARDLPDPTAVVAQDPVQSTKIYARDGKTLLHEMSGGQKRTVVELKGIAPIMQQATVAAEDDRFYQHIGIDPLAIARAAWQNLQSGEFVQGGSTITQQFVKNAILSGERTFTRKVKEIILSLELERRYPKDKILEFYLNTIPYGSGAYGVEAAAQTFFAKNANELNLSEAATLAALPRAPSHLSPYGSNSEDLKARRDYIINRMEQEGFISTKKASSAKQAKLNFERQETDMKAPHFVFYIQEILEEKYGKEVLQNQGLEVVTTLNWKLQKKAQEMTADWINNINSRFNAGNGALVALDPKTGQILSMVGSVDFWDFENDGQVNVTTRPRQPGSSFKPIVYSRAFEEGYLPRTKIFDLKTSFPGGRGQADYSPKNYTETFHGPVSIREALAQSINMVAVKTAYLIGVDDLITQARELGLATLKERSNYGLSIGLGAAEVKLLELTNAYSAFATEGTQQPTTPILKVTNAAGEVIQEYESRPEKVLETQVARQINSILADDQAREPLFGSASPLDFEDLEVAVKTGTTNNFIDAWTIGYTPNLVVGTWVGNNDNTPMKKASGYAVAPLWHNFFDFAAEEINLPDEGFIPLKKTQIDKPMVNGEFASRKTVKIDTITGKRATENTPKELIKEVSFKEAHNILHYIKKENPLGPIPKPEERDPLYEAWEEPVREWVENQPDSSEFTQKPPKEKDDVHTPENRPQIFITSPEKETEYKKTARINFSIEARGEFPIKQVDFYANGTLVGSDFNAPFEVSFQPGNLSAFSNSSSTPQSLKLQTTVFDEMLNTNSKEITIPIDAEN